MCKGPAAALPPRTPNYGKTPKYIEKYKEEAKLRELTKEEERAAKHRPVGTKILPEAERIKTLEDLETNKKRVLDLLTKLPISLRTESLKKQKVDLEKKLKEIDAAIETFKRKVVYVKQDA